LNSLSPEVGAKEKRRISYGGEERETSRRRRHWPKGEDGDSSQKIHRGEKSTGYSHRDVLREGEGEAIIELWRKKNPSGRKLRIREERKGEGPDAGTKP